MTAYTLVSFALLFQDPGAAIAKSPQRQQGTTLAYASGYQDPGGDVATKAEPLSIPFEILASRHMAVQMMVNGKGPYRVVFDTGAPFSLVSNRIAKEAGLSATRGTPSGARQERRQDSLPMFGMGGMMKIDDVEIGNVKVKKLPVLVFDHPTVKALASVVGKLDGIIGFPFFARYRTTIDYQQKKLFLEPVDYEPGDVIQSMMQTMMAPKNKPPIKRLGARTVWGFEVKKPESDEAEGVIVSKVLEGSPAAVAGLKAGDRLLILDGTWTDSLEDCWRAAGGVKAGRSVEAKILRDGRETRLYVRPLVGV